MHTSRCVLEISTVNGNTSVFFIFITTERRFPKIAGQWEDGQLKVNQVRFFLKKQCLTRSVFTKTFVEPQSINTHILISIA